MLHFKLHNVSPQQIYCNRSLKLFIKWNFNVSSTWVIAWMNNLSRNIVKTVAFDLYPPDQTLTLMLGTVKL